jgi:Ras-related GTP-binding protein A/B
MLKVLFAGLHNSGKTTILLALQKKYSQISGLKPTKGVERVGFDVLGLDLKVWDMGGQDEFRDKYFEKKEEYFSQTDILFYVIDVLDFRKYYESLTYFLKIVEVFKKQGIMPKIVIFIHKVDPDIQNDKIIVENIQKIHLLFTQEEGEIAFFETTIYNEWSIIQGFSYGLTALSKKRPALETQLKEFAEQTNSTFILLLDKNRVMIGSFKSDEMHKILGDRLMPIIDIYSDIGNLSHYKLTNLIAQLSDVNLFVQRVEVNKDYYYLMIISRSSNIGKIIEKTLPEFVKRLGETLKEFLLPIDKM